MTIKCIVFDLGGVIYVPSALEIWAGKVKERYGIPEEVSKKAFRKNFIHWEIDSWKEDEFFSSVAKELGASAEVLKDFLYSIENTLNKDLLSLIDHLKEKYTVVTLTNHTREWFDLNKDDIHETFHRVFASFELKMRKPDTEIYEHVLKELGLRPDEVLFIDDKSRNTEAAEKLKMHTIVFRDNESLKKKLKNIGVLE